MSLPWFLLRASPMVLTGGLCSLVFAVRQPLGRDQTEYPQGRGWIGSDQSAHLGMLGQYRARPLAVHGMTVKVGEVERRHKVPWTGTGPVVSMSLFFHTFDVRAKLTQLFVEMLVTAVDVINPAQLGDPVRLQTGENERSGSAQVTRHDRRA